jgi:hypothetical protein
MTPRPYAFIPLNLGSKEGTQAVPELLRLAVVDAEALTKDAELLSCCWNTRPKTAAVFRRFLYITPPGVVAEKRYFYETERLDLRILGLPPKSPCGPVNGDPLDCRKINLRVVPVEDIRAAALTHKPGSIVAALEGYQEAMAEYIHEPGKLRARQKTRRPAALTREQVMLVLEAALTHHKGATLADICGFILGEFGVKMYEAQVRLILLGKSYRIDGYDYKPVADSRPGVGKSHARWLERRQSIERKDRLAYAANRLEGGV